MSSPKWAVQHPEEILIYRFDGVQASGVYTGSFDSLQCVNDKLLWRAEESQLGNLAVLTLEEIEAQLEDSRIINVIGRVMAIERCARIAGGDCYDGLLLGVTTRGSSYNWLRMRGAIYCGRDQYYAMRAKFFYLLNLAI